MELSEYHQQKNEILINLHTIEKAGFPGARFPALQSCRLLLKKIIQNYSIGLLASSILLFCLWLPLIGKTDDSTLLRLDRIFTYREFDARSFGPAYWLDDESGYTVLESSESGGGGRDLVCYDSETGRREVLVPAWRFAPSGERTPLRIENYTWSPDRMKLLIFTNTNRGGQRSTQGDYWVFDLTFWNLRKLGGDADPGALMYGRFSPDSQKVGYVYRNNIYIEDLFTQQIIQLTKDGCETRINGASTRLYSGLNRTGFRWSHDGRFIVYLQFDTTGVKDFYLINNTDSLYPKIIPIQRVKPGERLPSCRAGVVEASGGETTMLKIPGDPRNHYIYQIDWAGNSQEVVVQQLNRQQNTMLVMMTDAGNGDAQTILTEEDEAWLDTFPLQWVNGGKHFVWVSEHDGWRHIYLVSRNGEKTQLLTPGKFDVFNIQSIDEQGGWVYYIASPDNPAQRYLYRVRLNGSGEIERVTPEGLDGTHSYQISPFSHWAFHTHSTIDTPPVIDLVRLPGHDAVRILADNTKINEKLEKIKRSPTEFFRIDIGEGVELDGWCLKPPNFDPEKRYPVLFYVYSMPANQTVLDRWGGNRHMWHIMMTQQGYIVMSVDSRGTPAPRGRAWRKIIYKRHGIFPAQDQAAAVRAIIARWSYVDPDRIGVYGWSGGGLMSLLLIFRYPDLYQTAMAGAYLSNHRFYHAGFTERFLGLPQDNPGAYRDTAALMYAKNLRGNLLLMHGTGDDNVHYQNTEALINELIAYKKRFSLMIYPNRSHGLAEGENTQYHRYDIYTWYLKQNLPGGGR